MERLSTRPAARILPANRFDWASALFSAWMIFGLYLDGWAHHSQSLESFFTPWHAVLYSGYAANALLLGLTFVRSLAQKSSLINTNALFQRQTWREALPEGYLLALLGAALFMVGGVADMVWHTLLGIEKSLDALLSPPHLFLALGGTLLITGPLRAALKAHRFSWPAWLSMSTLLAMIAFFTSYLHPWIELLRVSPSAPFYALRLSSYGSTALVIGSVLLQSTLLVGMALFALRAWRLPFGALTLLFALPVSLGLAMLEHFNPILLALLIGLAGDLLFAALRPAPDRLWAVRGFAFLLPVMIYSVYFIALVLGGGFSWLLTLWTGTILLSGFAGWLMSYAIFAPE